MAGFSAAGHLAAAMDVYEWTISYFLARKEVSTIRRTATSVGYSFHIAFLVARYTGQGAVETTIRISKSNGGIWDFRITPHANLPGSPSEGLSGLCIPL
jgi:hypothetical protein